MSVRNLILAIITTVFLVGCSINPQQPTPTESPTTSSPPSQITLATTPTETPPTHLPKIPTITVTPTKLSGINGRPPYTLTATFIYTPTQTLHPESSLTAGEEKPENHSLG